LSTIDTQSTIMDNVRQLSLNTTNVLATVDAIREVYLSDSVVEQNFAKLEKASLEINCLNMRINMLGDFSILYRLNDQTVNYLRK